MLLIALTWAGFGNVSQNDFITYDDPFYVTKNPDVNAGLTGRSVKWAFTVMHASNWHPLTWLSHMLDCELFGLNPKGHHLVNLALHTGNALLLFVLLRRLTGSLWRSGFIAALFAVHPMHVESVAWVSERKDVLSTFFGLSALLAYLHYVRWIRCPVSGGTAGTSRITHHASRWYGLALLLFALSLMSKPMLVTLPCLMLLLDYWPLRRFEWDIGAANVQRLIRLTLEKIPFLLLTAASCVLTVLAQSKGGSVAPTTDVDLFQRMSNSIIAYGWYVWRLFVPVDQAIIYPLLPTRPEWQFLTALALLAGMTALCVWQTKHKPWLLVGWFWFLGVLVPVIGLVQVGMQAYADRYTYLSYVGLFLVLTWSVAELTKHWHARARVLAPAAAVLLALCAVATHYQVQFWKDDETLYRRALAVTEKNYIALNNLGFTLFERGEFEQAIELCEASLRIAPQFGEALNTIGCARLGQARPDLALPCFKQAVLFRPHNATFRNNLGTALHGLERYEEAVRAYEAALQVDPRHTDSLYNLGNTLAKLDQSAQAIASYERAIALQPAFANAHLNLGHELLRSGRRADAKAAFSRALAVGRNDLNARFALGQMANEDGEFAAAEKHMRVFLTGNPDHAGALVQLAIALLSQQQATAATEKAREALRHSPEFSPAHYWLAVALEADGHEQEARQSYERVLTLEPDHAETLNNLAWLLTSSPDDDIRDGKRAVTLARRACELTKNQEPVLLGTLAAAYAETGDFTNAIATAETARDLAQRISQTDVARKNEELLKLYRAGRTCRELKTTETK